MPNYPQSIEKNLLEKLNQQRCLELSTQLMERAFSMQKNAIYAHPDWLFHAEHIRGIQDAEPFFRDAAHKLISSAKLGNVQAYYHLGCLYSLLGDNDKAMFFICKAEESTALPGSKELQQDEWLEGLRGTEEFHNFLAELEKKSHFQEDR